MMPETDGKPRWPRHNRLEKQIVEAIVGVYDALGGTSAALLPTATMYCSTTIADGGGGGRTTDGRWTMAVRAGAARQDPSGVSRILTSIRCTIIFP